MRYRLVNDGYPFKKIMQGRKWIGRVVRDQERGDFFARIGTTEARGPTDVDAFQRVVALTLGYADPEALRARNQAVARRNREHRDEVRRIADQMMAGDFSAIDRLFRDDQ